MISLYNKAKGLLGIVARDETGQDAFEYLLVIGVVMVAVVAAVVAGFTPGTLVTSVVGNITTAITALF